MPTPPWVLQTGTTLQGRYTIVGLLGQGGMGAVYLAREKALHQKPVAIKVLQQPEVAGEFEKEALILSRVSHPGLVEVTDFFIEEDRQHLVMAFVTGQNLLQVLERTPQFLDVARVVDWIRQVCDVLEHLHHQSPPIIVRDLKPSNIMLTAGNRIVLVDFGLARFYDASRTSTWQRNVGSPGFAPPEEYGLGSTDPRTDIYALGATLHMLLTRERPPTAMDLASGARVLAPASSINPAVPPGLDAVIARCMAVRRRERFQSVHEVRVALDGVSRPSPSMVVPLRGSGGGLLVLLLLAALGVSLAVVPRSQPPEAQLPITSIDAAVLGVGQVAISGDGQVIACCDRAGVHVLGKPGRTLPGAHVSALALDHDGSRALDGADFDPAGGDTPVRLWDVAEGKVVRAFHGARGSVVALRFDEAHGEVVAGTTCGFTTWRLEDGTRLQDIATTADAYAPTHVSGHGQPVQPGIPVAFASDGRLAAWASHFDVTVWDLQNGQQLMRFPYSSAWVSCVAFAPDNTHLWVGLSDGTIHGLDLSGRREIQTLAAHVHQVEALAALPDGQRLLSSGVDHRVRLWDVKAGRALASVQRPQLVSAIAVSDDGKLAATSSVTSVAEIPLP